MKFSNTTFIHILQFCIYLALLSLQILLTGDDIGVDVANRVGAAEADLSARLRGGLTLIEPRVPRWTAGGLGCTRAGVWGAINITNIINFIFNLLLNCDIHLPRHCRTVCPLFWHL